MGLNDDYLGDLGMTPAPNGMQKYIYRNISLHFNMLFILQKKFNKYSSFDDCIIDMKNTNSKRPDIVVFSYLSWSFVAAGLVFGRHTSLQAA